VVVIFLVFSLKPKASSTFCWFNYHVIQII
jgi:hypothetical protein